MSHEQGVVALWKRLGETPLEAVQRLKKERPEFAQVPMTYAGRLDPLAEGVLVVLSGDVRFRKKEFLALDKEYELDVLWGFATDSYDVLGNADFESAPHFSSEDLAKAVEALTGNIIQTYPPYSSKPVSGKPLFEWARKGKLSQIEIPTKEVVVHECAIIRSSILPKLQLEELIVKKINCVSGDFRQEKALRSWERALESSGMENFPITSFRLRVSSGTYVRGIAHSLGEKLLCGGVAVRIVRTKVGDHTASLGA